MLLATALALASTARGADTLEEIVVTAQKREQTLQSLPVAVSVVSKQQLDEALELVPGVVADLVDGT